MSRAVFCPGVITPHLSGEPFSAHEFWNFPAWLVRTGTFPVSCDPQAMLPLSLSGGSFSSLGWFPICIQAGFWSFLSVVFSLLWFSRMLTISICLNSQLPSPQLWVWGSTWVCPPWSSAQNFSQISKLWQL